MRTETLARAHLAARNCGFAESVARQAVEQQPDQVPPLAALVEILHAWARTRRRSRPIAGSSHWQSGPTATCLSSAGSGRSSPAGSKRRTGRAAAAATSTSDEGSPSTGSI